jgi:hypothetical protein
VARRKVCSAFENASTSGRVVLQPKVWNAARMIKQVMAEQGCALKRDIIACFPSKIVPMTFPSSFCCRFYNG